MRRKRATIRKIILEIVFALAIVYLFFVTFFKFADLFLSTILNYNSIEFQYSHMLKEVAAEYIPINAFSILFIAILGFCLVLDLRNSINQKNQIEILNDLKRIKYKAKIVFICSSILFLSGHAYQWIGKIDSILESSDTYVAINNKIIKVPWDKVDTEDRFIYNSVLYQNLFGISIGYSSKEIAIKQTDILVKDIIGNDEKNHYLKNFYSTHGGILYNGKVITKNRALEIYDDNQPVWIKCYEPSDLKDGAFIEIFTSEASFKESENKSCVYYKNN